MSATVVEPSLATIDSLSGVEALCLLVTEDERPLGGASGFVDWRLCGALSRVLQGTFFAGKPDERLLMTTQGRVPPEKLFAVGLGLGKSITALGYENALKATAQMLVKAQVKSVALALPTLPQFNDEATAAMVNRGFLDGYDGRVTVFAPRGIGARLA